MEKLTTRHGASPRMSTHRCDWQAGPTPPARLQTMRPCGRLARAGRSLKSIVWVVAWLAWMTTVTPTTPALGACGQPQSTGALPTASDALAVLNVSVGIGTCSLCVCDVDASGQVMATDALIVLRAAIGLSVTLQCGACETSTTSSSTSTSTSSSTTTPPAAALASALDAEASAEQRPCSADDRAAVASLALAGTAADARAEDAAEPHSSEASSAGGSPDPPPSQ